MASFKVQFIKVHSTTFDSRQKHDKKKQLPLELIVLLMEIMDWKKSSIASFTLINLSKQNMLAGFSSDA